VGTQQEQTRREKEYRLAFVENVLENLAQTTAGYTEERDRLREELQLQPELEIWGDEILALVDDESQLPRW